jgi:mono/diheme cytochrome c family protein
MNYLNRFLMVFLAFFFAAASMTACKSKSNGESPQTSGITRRAFLNDKQVVSASPVHSSASGTAMAVMDTATNRLTGTVALSSNVTGAAVYISDGDAGSNGAFVVSLVETPSGSGIWTIPDTAGALSSAQADRFRAAGFYVNVSTFAAPDGEIRGQLLSYADNIQPIFDQHCVRCHNSGGAAAVTGLFLSPGESYARLVGQPATQSPGTRVVPFDAGNSMLMRRIAGVGYAGTAHMPPNGPYLSAHDEDLIKAWINMGAIDDSGVFSQPASTLQTQFVRRAFLNAKQVISAPPVLSAATGAAAVTLDTTTSRLTGTATLSNFSNAVTAVHISDGDSGGNGGLVIALVETPAGSGTWTVPATAPGLTSAQMDRFKIAGLYVSVDTAANPGGEIRGQLLSYAENIQPLFNFNCAECHYALGQAVFVGLKLTPADSYASLVNQPATQSTGARVVPFDADNSVLLQRITGVGFSTIVGLPMPPDYSHLPPLSTRDQDLIRTWINMGAIDESGAAPFLQPIPSRTYKRNAFLSAVQVVPAPATAVTSTATGTVALDTATGKLTGTVVISSISSTVTAVKIFDGDADNNGALVVSLAETSPGGGIWTVPTTAPGLSDLQMNRFIAAGLYVSVETFANPNGEIRGQLQTYADNVQLIFNVRCVKCHDAGVVLLQGQSYTTLVNQPATDPPGIRVMPFDAASSVLYNRLAGNGFPPPFQMPLDGPPYLPLREINIIKTWINMGARND